jgi:predicted unusual protein kinase regulating ubiquinone biosynthesis (AarF/ABC1/UbiB family)
LANPDKVAKELPNTVLKSFDEQFMLMKKGGQSVMHGDPHTGNFFITQNKKGKLIPEFIDTGSCVKRTGKQIKDDISFFSNYFVGNSRGIAEYFVKQCPHSQANIEQITQAITKDIQTQIFGKTQNICKFSDVQATITDILEKHGLQMSTESATAMKAQMQFFSAVSEAGKLTGQPVDILTVIKDIPQAVWGMAKNGTNPWSAIKDACKFAFHNQKQAVGTAYQFKIKDIDSVLKADGTLAAVV